MSDRCGELRDRRKRERGASATCPTATVRLESSPALAAGGTVAAEPLNRRWLHRRRGFRPQTRLPKQRQRKAARDAGMIELGIDGVAMWVVVALMSDTAESMKRPL